MQDKRYRILFVEDDRIDLMVFERFARKGRFPYNYITAGSVKEASAVLESEDFDAIVADYSLGDGTAFDLFDRIEDTPIIIVTGIGDEEIAVQAMKLGARDYLVKSTEGNHLEVLSTTIEKAISYKQTEDELRRYRENLEELVRERTAELEAEIAERKQAEEALKQSEERYRTLVERMTDGLGVQDENGIITYVNNRLCEMWGYSRDEIIGQPVTAFLDEANRKVLGEQFARRRKGEQEAYEIGWTGKDGRKISTLMSPSPLFNVEGNFRGSFAVITDITERRRMEEELLKVQKLESIGTLAGGIAHDLNNLLTGVLGNISLARMCENPADKDRRLAEAEKASMRIKDLTHQLLTFSKGGAPIKKLSPIAEILKSSANFALRGSNVRCEFSIPDDLWPANVDEGRINQVINNLIINADQAMPNGGTVRISAENTNIGAESGLPLDPGSYIEVSVEDEGTGIPEDHIQKIFDPFFSTKQAGSGLGLATSYSIIEKHDGHITVESQLGAGTTFHIYLPASPEEVLVTEKEEAEDPVMGEGRILVMDDEEVVRELASDILVNIGYEVITAIDGAQAIELYKKAMESGNPFDAVIIDLTIPGGMGGKETIQRLVEIDPNIKAIVSSGYSNDPMLADFGRYGFKGVIAKPYKTREMSEVLHKGVAEL